MHSETNKIIEETEIIEFKKIEQDTERNFFTSRGFDIQRSQSSIETERINYGRSQKIKLDEINNILKKKFETDQRVLEMDYNTIISQFKIDIEMLKNELFSKQDTITNFKGFQIQIRDLENLVFEKTNNLKRNKEELEQLKVQIVIVKNELADQQFISETSKNKVF